MESTKTNIEIQKLLHKLRQKELSDSEWDLLTSRGADDDFLADALEGLRAMPQEEREARIRSIEESLVNLLGKKQEKNVLMIRLRRVAAAAVLLIGIWAIWQVYPVSNLSLAMQQDKKENGKSGLYKEGEPQSQEEEAANGLEKNFRIAVSKLKREINKPWNTENPDAVKSDGEVVENDVAYPERGDHSDADTDLAEGQTDVQAQAQIQTQTHAGTSIEGQTMVQSQAQIQTHTQTPTLGPAHNQTRSSVDSEKSAAPEPPGVERDNLRTRQTDSSNPVTNAMTEGMNEAEVLQPVRLDDIGTLDEKPVNSEMSEGMELNEASAQNLQVPMAKKNQGPQQVAYALAMPLGGWDDYYKHIRKNIVIPDAAKDASVEGTVRLEFDLKKDGTAYNFRITQSLGFGCDEEAIRLVREGPQWDVRNAQVPIGRLSIDF